MNAENTHPSSPIPHTLESIVPPLDLCEKIPPGEFEDTALIWFFCGSWFVNAREFDAQSDEEFPAPTMQEILAKLAESGDSPRLIVNHTRIGTPLYRVETNTDWIEHCNAAEAALKLWLIANSILSIPSIPSEKEGDDE